MNRSTLFGIVIGFLFVCSQWTVAQENLDEGLAGPKTVLRAYEISDLLIWPSTYPYASSIAPVTRLQKTPGESAAFGGGFGGGGGGISSPEQKSRSGSGGGLFAGGSEVATGDAPTLEEREMVITDLIQTNIDPDDWRDAGGLVGTMTAVGGKLFVVQTQESHDAIASLLAELRKDRHQQIGINARWIRMPVQSASELGDNPEGNGNTLDPSKLTAWIKSNPQAVVYEARTNCFNTQTVNIASGHGQTVVVGSQVVLASGSKGVQPQVEQVFIGALLEITPTLYPGGNDLVVDVHSVVSEEFSATHSKTHEDDMLDRLKFSVQHFDTTTRIPVGVPVLIGGMTTSREDSREPLYLILEVNKQ